MPEVRSIEEAEQILAGLYAPTARITVNGEDVLTDRFLEILSTQVDLAIDKADQFTFVINNAFDIERRDFGDALQLFDFGASVEIEMGYQDRSKMELMIAGIVTSVTTSFPASSAPQLTIMGYDRSYCLMKGSGSDNWEDQTVASVVQEIAQKHNLDSVVDDTGIVQPKIEQNQESHYQFLERLAQRYGFEFFVHGTTLYFVEPANDESGVLELEWGRGLMSFSPVGNIAEQVAEIEVRGWDVNGKTEFIGTALAGVDEPGVERDEQAGGTYVAKVCSDTKVSVRRAVSSQQEADQWAAALLKQRAEGFVRGDGETIGLPGIRPGTNIKLSGLGERFSRDYFIESCTHTVNASGYRTTFKVKDTSL